MGTIHLIKIITKNYYLKYNDITNLWDPIITHQNKTTYLIKKIYNIENKKTFVTYYL
jgi:hypothetical protein